MPNAASGNPPPIDFARQIMSGVTPKYSEAPPQPSFAPGLHFVEDQQRAVFGGNVAQPFEEAGLRHAQSDVHQDRFENDRRDLAGIFLEAALDGCQDR